MRHCDKNRQRMLTNAHNKSEKQVNRDTAQVKKNRVTRTVLTDEHVWSAEVDHLP